MGHAWVLSEDEVGEPGGLGRWGGCSVDVSMASAQLTTSCGWQIVGTLETFMRTKHLTQAPQLPDAVLHTHTRLFQLPWGVPHALDGQRVPYILDRTAQDWTGLGGWTASALSHEAFPAAMSCTANSF